MSRIDWNEIDASAMPSVGGSVLRRFFSGEQLTVAKIAFEAGAATPAHRHHNEQYSMVLSGKMEFLVEEVPMVILVGEGVHLKSEQWHGARALEDSVVLDVFAPPRTDWEKQ